MGNSIQIINTLHISTKRNYLERMNNSKIECMRVARRFDKSYWDGDRKFGYGGYKYMPNRWTNVAKIIIKKYKLSNRSKILDVGCGKGFLLLEIFKILPKIKIYGIDISKYAIKKAPQEIKRFLSYGDISKKLKFKKKYFDLTISINTLHNLKVFNLFNALKEINRVSKKTFISVESYRNEKELFNLQCWALTCNSFFSKDEWEWIFKKCKYSGDYEFIYF